MAPTKKVKKVYLGVTNIDNAIFSQAAQEVEKDWKSFGLAGTMYEEYAHSCLKKYVELISKHEY